MKTTPMVLLSAISLVSMAAAGAFAMDRGHEGGDDQRGPQNHAPIHRINEPVPPHHEGDRPDPGQGRKFVHWNHPAFQRPSYSFRWERVRSMTCTAQDSLGDQYPVTDTSYGIGQYEAQMPAIEDEALDECYNDSSDGASCVLVTCLPGY